MFKFFSLLILFVHSTFAMQVAIVATVNDKVITSFDVTERAKISQTLNPEIFKNASGGEVKTAILERLIQEEKEKELAERNKYNLQRA